MVHQHINVLWEGIDKQVQKNQPKKGRKVVLVPLHKRSTKLHLQYNAKTYMAWSYLQISKYNLYLLFLATTFFHCLSYFSSYSSKVFLPPLISQLPLNFITYARTWEGWTDRSPIHSKEEENKEDHNMMKIESKGHPKWFYLLHTQ